VAEHLDIPVYKSGKMLNRVQNGLNLKLNSWSPFSIVLLCFVTGSLIGFLAISYFILPPWTSPRRLWARGGERR
jgi:hypothetical protein